MSYICPLCNGLYEIKYDCTRCSSKMEDIGPVVNYMDNYSPYLLDDITHLIDGVSRDKCIHIFKCSSCNYEKKCPIDRERI